MFDQITSILNMNGLILTFNKIILPIHAILTPAQIANADKLAKKNGYMIFIDSEKINKGDRFDHLVITFHKIK